jgi:hypothetical protein
VVYLFSCNSIISRAKYIDFDSCYQGSNGAITNATFEVTITNYELQPRRLQYISFIFGIKIIDFMIDDIIQISKEAGELISECFWQISFN